MNLSWWVRVDRATLGGAVDPALSHVKALITGANIARHSAGRCESVSSRDIFEMSQKKCIRERVNLGEICNLLQC